MNSEKDGLASVLPMKSTVFLYIVLLALISSCTGDRDESKSLSFAVDGQSRRVQQTQAERLLGFKIVLPTFLPSGTANAPELKIQRAFGGDRGLVATYYEKAGSTDGVRVRITLTKNPFGADTRSDLSLGTVNGFDVKFLTNTFGSGAEFIAILTRPDVNIILEVAWLVRVPSRDEMREEAKKIIASIQRIEN